MAVNKVIYNDEVLIDTSSVTVTAAAMRSGYTALDKAGNKITGTMKTVTVPSPTITVSSSGLITASTTPSAGYQSGGTKSKTKQLSTQSAKTYTPSTTNQTIASGIYTTGVQTIKGDTNLIADNIKEGVSIFGVLGTFSGGGGTAVASGTVLSDGEPNVSITHDLGTTPTWIMLYTTATLGEGHEGLVALVKINNMPTMAIWWNTASNNLATSSMTDGIAVTFSDTEVTINTGSAYQMSPIFNKTYSWIVGV